MQLEATGKPLKYRLRSGKEILFQPGCPVDVPDESARELLKKAGDRVRVVSPAPVVIESAHQNARPVYWERANGRIRPDRLDRCLIWIKDLLLTLQYA